MRAWLLLRSPSWPRSRCNRGRALRGRRRRRRACASRPTSRPRNDIRLENRVPVRMRDGVTLYADVYRPVEEGTLSGPGLADALQHRALPHRLRCGRLLRPARLRLRLPGHPRDATSRKDAGSRSSTTRRTATTRRVGGEAALVERQGRHAGRLLSGPEPVAGRAGRRPRASSPSSRWWPPPASTTTGSRSTAAGACRSTSAGDPCARNRGSCRTPGPHTLAGAARHPLRPGAVAPAPEHDAAARGTKRALLRRLAGPPRLRRLLEAAQRGGAVRQDQRSRSTRSAAGSTSSARGRCADTSG